MLLGLLYWENCVYLLCSRMRGERGTGAETPGMPGRSPDRLKALPETRKVSTSQCSRNFAVQFKFRGLLRISWNLLGAFFGPLGTSLGDIGGLLGRLGASESRKGEKAKNFQKLYEHQLFLPLRALLGGLLGRIGGFLGRLEAFLGVLDRSFEEPELSWTVLGGSWGFLGALWGA